ncbi:MAG TPA: T9SS type A sorting domain-containing protein [Bacteroidales bacterium]|nr:T9SS type A sorting domain-containing protein [Bacteroidales bacterium]
MKYKLLLLLMLILLAGTEAFEAKAQNLVIKTKDGDENIELLSSLQDFTFSENNLLLNYLSGSTEIYSISNISTLYFRNVQVTGIGNFTLNEDTGEIFFYPNPAGSIIHVHNLHEGTLTVHVYRMDGVMLLCTQVSSASETVDVSDLESGLYLVKSRHQVFKLWKL